MAILNTHLIAFFVVLFATVAFAHRTTITTVEIDDDVANPSKRCQGRERLESCQQFLRQQRYSVLLQRGIDIDNDNDNPREEFNQCCQQLRRVDEQCRCDALRDVVREVQQHGGEKEGRQVLQKARILPVMCGLRSQRCDF